LSEVCQKRSQLDSLRENTQPRVCRSVASALVSAAIWRRGLIALWICALPCGHQLRERALDSRVWHQRHKSTVPQDRTRDVRKVGRAAMWLACYETQCWGDAARILLSVLIRCPT